MRVAPPLKRRQRRLIIYLDAALERFFLIQGALQGGGGQCRRMMERRLVLPARGM